MRPAGPQETAPDARPRLSPGRALLLALLAATTFAVFAGALRNAWITFDDPFYVLDNPHVRGGWRFDQALWFLSHPHGANWHPLTSWSHMVDVQLFGLAPAGPHAVNLMLHVLNATLLAWVLSRLTGAWWRSMLVAACFALHPLRVESVAWVAERKDALSGLFFVLTLAAYRHWAARPGPARYTALLASLTLGLMSKPMLVTLPFVLLLLDVWPLGRLRGGARAAWTRAPARPLAGLIAEKWPLFALSATSAILTFLVQRGSGAVAPVDLASPARRITNALVSYWRYVGMTFWPRDLAVFYPYALAPQYAAAAVAALGLVAVTGLFVWQARRRPYLLVGWLWYLGMLVPAIGLIQVGGQAYADRYTYLATIGLVVAPAWYLGDLVSGSRPARAAVAGASVLILAALSFATVRQVALWKDTRTLFDHALAVTHDNLVAHEKLGELLMLEGKLQLAIPHFEEALRIQPDFADANVNLAIVLTAMGRCDEALGRFRAGLRSGGTANGHTYYGLALAKLGRLDEAIAEYEAALRIEPDRAATLVQLGTALRVRGRYAESASCLQRVVDAGQANDETRRLLAETLVRAGRVEAAIGAYEGILRGSPDDLDALNNVAWIRATCADARLRDGAEAVRLAERARDRSPVPVAVLYSTLAAAYAEAGRFPEAVQAGERAVALARNAGAGEEAGRYAGQCARYRAGKRFHFDR
jgi:protein O-mannosyl-transferase